jgi:hypothetical protein
MTLSIAAAAALLSIAKGFSKPPQITPDLPRRLQLGVAQNEPDPEGKPLATQIIRFSPEPCSIRICGRDC